MQRLKKSIDRKGLRKSLEDRGFKVGGSRRRETMRKKVAKKPTKRSKGMAAGGRSRIKSKGMAAGGRSRMKSKGMRAGGMSRIKSKGMRAGGMSRMKSKGMKAGGATAKTMTLAQLRAAAKVKGYKLTKA